jgi:hypothetical protein
MRQTERCECGVVLLFENATRSEHRTPCPSCGSRIRLFEVAFEEVLSIRASFAAKAKGNGRKPFHELFNGAAWSTRFQKFMEKTRIIDRRSDQYCMATVNGVMQYNTSVKSAQCNLAFLNQY